MTLARVDAPSDDGDDTLVELVGLLSAAAAPRRTLAPNSPLSFPKDWPFGRATVWSRKSNHRI